MTDRPDAIVYIARSLDGFIARPDGGIDWLGDPSGDEDYGWSEFIDRIDHILMGRATFEKVLEFGTWPYEGTPLTVLSSTMADVPAHLSEKAGIGNAPPAALLEELGALGVQRVYVDGGRTVQGFLAEDLIDEMVITTIPVLIGEGIPLFGPLPADLEWEHASTETFASGFVKSRYVRKRDQAGGAA